MECSTPYGITARCIRLGRRPLVWAAWCSTPYGITARCMPHEDHGALRRLVLNALRHHGSVHIVPAHVDRVGIRHVLNALRHHGSVHLVPVRSRARRACGAQRLTASRLGASPPGAAPPWMRSMGAQRLTASRLGACGDASPLAAGIAPCSTPYGITARCMRLAARGRRRGRRVLNALRHHGSVHPPRSTRCRRPRAVLNALRHHGSVHYAARARRGGSDPPCSTPYGITARCIVTVPPDARPRDSMCSTPYGITARCIAREPDARSCVRLGAQRLTASRLGAFTSRGAATAASVALCSTPYGITARCISEQRRARAPIGRAQRLTASRLGAFRAARCAAACGPGGAQRLTASRLGACTRAAVDAMCGAACAQRLTASRLGA